MAFADLALERFSRSAPDLVKTVVSFHDLTEEAEVSAGMSIGVFLLRVGKENFFVPVIAKGNTLFPIDSVYVEDTGKFMPLTKHAPNILLAYGQRAMGKSAKPNKSMAKNPSIKDLVEPPKTGKFTYASALLPEALAMVSAATRKDLLSKLAADRSILKSMHSLGIDTKEFMESLEKTAAVVPVTRPVKTQVRVVAAAESGLSEQAIQDIKEFGFTVLGSQTMARLSIPYEADCDDIGHLPSSFTPGQAFDVFLEDGSIVLGMPVQTLQAEGPARKMACREADRKILLLEDGGYIEYSTGRENSCQRSAFTPYFNQRPVVKTTPKSAEDIILSIAAKGLVVDVADLVPDSQVLILTPKGFLPIFEIDKVTHEGGVILLRGFSRPYGMDNDGLREIAITPSVHGGVAIIRNRAFITPECKAFLVYCSDKSPQKSISLAQATRNALQTRLVPEKHVLRFNGVEYTFDGLPVGGVEKIAKVLIEDAAIDVAAAKGFLKMARENREVTLCLSKMAGLRGAGPMDNSEYALTEITESSKLAPIPQEGLDPGVDMGNALSERKFSGKKVPINTALIKEAAATKDRSITEASVLSELLKDPDMSETILSYMPVIDDAIDKLGRTIFLLRINNDTMVEKISPEDYSRLVAALRNTYRMLGENKITLEQIITNGGDN
jgi:hypothetical protein